MKNANLIFATILFAIFTLTSCQKERLDEMVRPIEMATIEQMDVESIFSKENLAKANIQKVDFSSFDRNAAKSRNNCTLIYETIMSNNGGTADVFYMSRADFPDPTTHKIEVKVIPMSGNPVLIFAGTDAQNTSFREIRQSRNAGLTEESDTYRLTDLETLEDRINIIVNGQSTYRIEFSICEVDCLEYPPVEQFIRFNIAPVCTCDNVQFINSDDARNNGYTSWTSGPCTLDDGRYRNVELNNPNADLIINRIRISGSSSYIRFRSTVCLDPSRDVCLWDRVPLTYDINTGKWVAHAERSNNRKSMEIDIEIVRNGDLLEAAISYSTIEILPNGTLVGDARMEQETFEKI